MLKTKTKDIEIWYDEKDDIEKIKRIIDNNYVLFLKEVGDSLTISFVETESDVLYIKDIDEYMDKAFKPLFQNDKVYQEYQKIPLENIYLAFLARNILDDVKLIKINKKISDESFNEIFSIILPLLYYREKNDVEKYLDYMKYRDKDESLKIYLWLKNKCRYRTYNMVQEIIIEKLKSDSFVFQNIDNILDLMYEETKGHDNLSEDKITLPKLCKEQRDALFMSFLNFIDAPDYWKEIFCYLNDNHLITYEEQGDEEASRCYQDDQNIIRISIKSDGTIKDFLSLAHEFAHYIAFTGEVELGNWSIMEFPSIFFEKLAFIFLIKCGYNKEIVAYADSFRNEHNWITAFELYPVFASISEYIKNGEISREKEIMDLEKLLDKCSKSAGRDVTLQEVYQHAGVDLPPMTISEFVDQKYDKLTRDMIRDGIDVLDGFQYIIGTYLAREVLNHLDRSTIDKMVMVTNELSSFNLESILKLFNIDIFKKGKRKVKE